MRYSVVPGWDGIGGECTHLSSFGRTRRQSGGGGSHPGGVGGAGAPVKWPQGDLKCFRGSSPKAWESVG